MANSPDGRFSALPGPIPPTGLVNDMVKHPVDQPETSQDASLEDSEDQRRDEVNRLARKVSHQSDHRRPTEYEGNPLSQPGTALDPHSEKFSYKQWAKAVLQLQKEQTGSDRPTAGFSFRNLNVHGFGSPLDYQRTVQTVVYQTIGHLRDLVTGRHNKIQILRDFNGLVLPGELLVVLGPPGSGCSTLLKTVTGEMNGIYTDETSQLNYHGVSVKDMQQRFRGEAIYTAEVDVHFPQLSVGDTLYFAARARAPRAPPGGVTQHEWAEHRRDVIMAIFGISHTINTRVGNDFVRGVSGGERKRVSLAEATLSDAPLQAWDNSTRGLDSANAIEFCKNLRLGADILGTTAALAIYQAPQAAYDCFNKATVLYEGHQIFFGPSHLAKQYFIELGFECPDRQTDPDFLTSMCSPEERRVRPGFEGRVPQTPEEFARAWQSSSHYAQLIKDIEAYNQKYPVGGESMAAFTAARRSQQAKNTRAKSPFTLSYTQQIKLCIWRSYQRLKGDPTLPISQVFGNAVMALIVSSIFYNLQPFTEYFYSFNALLFFALLLAAFGSALEILMLYAQRPIVEKQARYCFYHPSAEAWASMLSDIPSKILNTIGTSLIYYFMTNLNRHPGNFFFYLFTAFTTLMAMSMLFRFIGSASRSLLEALVPTAVLILMLVIYTGFAINTRNMKSFMRWLNYVDIVAYGFEAVMINQYAGRTFGCSQFIPSGPGYENVPADSQVCSVVGAVAGSDVVSGDTYLEQAYGYLPAHKWRNIGILWGFVVFFLAGYMIAAETVLAKKSKGEVLVFKRGHVPKSNKKKDVEEGEKALRQTSTDSSKTINVIKQTASFCWKDVCYEIKIKKEPRVILDHVDGWVVPGRITALMGVSGAGKTTLLDVLASRVTMGVVTGEMLGLRYLRYVQQQDLHLETSTVREALNFAALLRQPAHLSKQEKLDYVDEVIRLLDMGPYADAVVGVPGEGLNVEQRKRLTIGVELAAKPELLLFLDEPTSGLDSQTSWSILDLLDKLAKAGQSILITCHQPSAMLFERFDRLLLLAKGGRTVYFGEIGKGARTLIDYFERNGAPECPRAENPAEYMLTAIGAAPGTHTDIDWFQTWRTSPEYAEVQKELERRKSAYKPDDSEHDAAAYRPFAVSYTMQFKEAMKRITVQYWRTPTYIYSKLALCVASALFISLSFLNAGTSLAGLQNQLFAIFALFTIFSQYGNQIMPNFVIQRALYESRERASKTYSWVVFMLVNILIEMPWNIVTATLTYLCWYWPIYNTTNPSSGRAGLMFLFFIQFFVYASTFFHMLIAALESAEAAGNLASLLFSLALVFNGVLRPPSQLPQFWIFMYRVSPFTYLLQGMIATAVANQQVVCADVEYLRFNPPNGRTCGEYIQSYQSNYGGYLLDPNATTDCSFCSASNTNSFLASISTSFDERWRNFGILWAYIVFHIFAAIFFYWLGRVPKKNKNKDTAKTDKKISTPAEKGDHNKQG